jgi:ectoine hydroxylase-related dioxygenase (phytanoyl-CoA dioxygenase family)
MADTVDVTPPLTADEVARFRRDGYIVLRGCLDAATVDRLQTAIRRHANADFAAILNPDRIEFLQDQSSPEQQAHCEETAATVREIMCWPDLVAALEALQGEPVVGLMSQMLFKEAGSRYADQAWRPHQDNSYPQSPNAKYITTNIFLQPVDVDNGTLYVYPGTQREPILSFEPNISYREDDGRPGNEVRIPDGYEKVDITAEAGDVLVMNGNLIHGSYANRHPTRSRPLLSCSYISKGEPFVPGNTAKREVIPLR